MTLPSALSLQAPLNVYPPSPENGSEAWDEELGNQSNTEFSRFLMRTKRAYEKPDVQPRQARAQGAEEFASQLLPGLVSCAWHFQGNFRKLRMFT